MNPSINQANKETANQSINPSKLNRIVIVIVHPNQQVNLQKSWNPSILPSFNREENSRPVQPRHIQVTKIMPYKGRLDDWKIDAMNALPYMLTKGNCPKFTTTATVDFFMCFVFMGGLFLKPPYNVHRTLNT